MHFRQRDVLARIPHAGFGVGALGGLARIFDEPAVPGAVLHLPTMAGAQLHRLDGDGIGDSEPARDVRRRDDRAGRAVGDAATIEQPQRIGDHRRFENRLDVDRLAQMRARVRHRVLMALPAHMRHGAFEIDVIDPIARGIGAGELRERTGRRAVGQPEIVGETLGAQRQAAVAGVLQLFDAQREREIDRAGRDRVDGGAQSLRAGRAHVLDARDRNALQAQRMRERQCAVADIDVVERIAHPGRLDLDRDQSSRRPTPPRTRRPSGLRALDSSARRTSCSPCRRSRLCL